MSDKQITQTQTLAERRAEKVRLFNEAVATMRQAATAIEQLRGAIAQLDELIGADHAADG